MRSLSLVVARGSYSLVAVYQASHCSGFLQSTGSEQASGVQAYGLESTGSVVVVHTLSCHTTCAIFLDQALNPHLLHWQADS